MRGIIVDNFAGGGGASTGIEMAIGRSVDIAINHDPAAIAMHKANHADTEHYCESVWDVSPEKACKGRTVDLAWFSPDCKHFSKAKGKKPVSKNIRGLAWVAVKWAKAVRPNVIMLENVEEFKTWGPLIEDEKGDLYPDTNRKGETFNLFIASLEKLGYQVEFRELKACDYGAPTIRKRFFMVARCDGRQIVWPDTTHAHIDSQEVIDGFKLPWRTASEIIDWTIPCPSIFDRKKELAENTMRRIAKGIQKFVIDNPRPYIVRIGQTGFGGDNLQYPLDKPLTTITSKAEHCLVTPFLATYHTETKADEVRGSGLDTPIHTLDTSNRYALVSAFVSRYFGTSVGHIVDSPLATCTAVNKSSLVQMFLTTYYGNGEDVGQRLDEPLRTITTKDRFGVVKIEGNDYQIIDIGMRMLAPRELFAAQGFPSDYIIDKDFEGKPYPKSAQVARCGNAVPPPFAEALVRANLPELCEQEERRSYVS